MRIIAAIVLLFLLVSVSPLFVAPFVLLYAWYWFAPELIIFGALIDAYFGVDTVASYTLTLTLLILIIEWLRPKLSLYTM